MKAADAWWLTLDGELYGPYRLARLRSFAAEGRLIGASLVGRDADGPFGPAFGAPELADLFVARRTRLLVVCVDLLSMRARERFASAVNALGDALQPLAGLWLLRTAFGAATVRNLLSRDLGAGERLIAAEAAPNDLAWFGLEGELDRAARVLVGTGSNTSGPLA